MKAVLLATGLLCLTMVIVFVSTQSNQKDAYASGDETDHLEIVDGHITYELSAGWNFRTWMGTDKALFEKVLYEDRLTNSITAVYGWNESEQQWEGYFPDTADVPGANDLSFLETNKAYWFYVDRPNGIHLRVMVDDSIMSSTPTSTSTPSPTNTPEPTQDFGEPTEQATNTPETISTNTPETEPTSTPEPTNIPEPTATPTPATDSATTLKDCSVSDYSLNSKERELIELINNYRKANGLENLSTSITLNRAAHWMAQDLSERESWSGHTDSLGRSPYARAIDCGYPVGASENIAGSSAWNTAEKALSAWKNSPGHNANLLSPRYRAIGLAVVHDTNARYDWIWVVELGTAR